MELLLLQGFDFDKLEPGQPLVELTGSPVKVQQVDMERHELLLHGLVRASLTMSMREATFHDALVKLDLQRGGKLANGNISWHKMEAIKFRILMEYT